MSAPASQRRRYASGDERLIRSQTNETDPTLEERDFVIVAVGNSSNDLAVRVGRGYTRVQGGHHVRVPVTLWKWDAETQS
jgi:hypothetical protein